MSRPFLHHLRTFQDQLMSHKIWCGSIIWFGFIKHKENDSKCKFSLFGERSSFRTCSEPKYVAEHRVRVRTQFIGRGWGFNDRISRKELRPYQTCPGCMVGRLECGSRRLLRGGFESCWECRWDISESLRWLHNGHDGLSYQQPHDCLLNRLFGRRSK